MSSTQDNSGSENIRCIVRCRPLNQKEAGLGSKCVTISSDSKVVFVENKNDKLSNGKYAMDHVFNENVTQEEVFQEIGEPIMKSFIGGYNCTIFCYGQTGAGKTHTMMGPLEQLFEENSASQGLIPRIIHYLFNEETKVKNIITGGNIDKSKNIQMNIKFCVMELYQESIIDLLKNENNSNPTGKNQNDKANELKIKEDPKKGMYVQGITEVEIKTAKEAKNLILTGLKSRHVAATEMNAESSRSHLLFSIFLSTSYINSRGGKIDKTSRLHLIDLAGSERQKKTKAQGERIKEACMINKSLSTLGNVINALVENYEGKNKYIPFRDSKLTYFLKDSLGGNSKTTIVANISTSLIQMNETISTLKFVQRAKMIKNSATLNMSVQENIEALQEEIKKLKSIIAKGGKYIDDDININGNENNNGVNNNNINNKNYICPICNNQPIEVNQEKMFQNFKTEINQLMELIIKNFKSEENVKNQFMNLDKQIISSGFQFYSLVEQYKSEYAQKLKELDTEIKTYQKFISEMKESMDKANQKVINFKFGDSMDRITFGEINQLNIQADEILKKLETYDIVNIKKLETENEFLSKEIEISTDIKKILDLKIKNEIEQKEINTDVKNIQNSVGQFINSNDKIIKFFAENFLNKPYFKEELVLLEKSKYDMLLFQIGEGKMTERSLKKQMEQMEMDNYLANIDLIRMKNQIDAYKSNKRASSINANLNNNFESHRGSNKEIDTIEEDKNEEDKANKDDNKNEMDKKEIKKKDEKNNDDSYDSNPDDSDSDNDKNEKEEDKDKEKEKEIEKEEVKDKEKEKEKEIEKEKEKEEETPFIKRPLDRKRTRKGIMRVGSLDTTAALEKTKKFAVNIDNLEFVKMQERLDEMNEDLSQKIADNEELNQQVYDLNNLIESLNLKIQEKEDNIKELNTQIEALDTTNEVFEKNIEELSNYKKFVDKEISDIINTKEQNDDKLKHLIEIYNNMNEMYKNKCDDLFKKNKNLIVKNEEKINVIELNNNDIMDLISQINTNENNFTSLYDLMKENIDTLQNKLEIKQNTINNLNKSRNEIIEEKNKMEEKYKSEINSLNNDVIKYKNIILNKNKIIQIYIENEQYIHLQFEEIEKLISSNNIKLNNLKEIYCTDLSLINKYYINVILTYKKKVINVLDKNDIDIAEIKQQLKSSNESFDYLNKIYNSFSNIYFDKCCTLLNEINKKEINIKYLSDKNNMQQISENNLNQKISSLEQENSLLKQEIKNAKQTNEIKLEENTKFKKDIEDLENQIKNLNNEILSYLDQIKQKEKIFEELNSNQKKINMNLKDLENQNKTLNLSLNEKNALINKFQSESNKLNLLINELNTKNLSLIQELEKEKNNDSLYKQEKSKSVNQLNELNAKINTLFTEITNKDKIITNLNNEHAELSKQINDFILEKNENMEKISQKEEEINKNQQDIFELNNKLLDTNRKLTQVINENKEKIEEIAKLNKLINENKQSIEDKNEVIKKLNNKIRINEELNKKGMKMNNNYLNANPINYENYNIFDDEKNLNGMMNINMDCFYNENKALNGNKFVIDLLKKKNEELIKDNLKTKNDVYKLNNKFIIAEYLSNLFFKLLNEFSSFQTKLNNNQNHIQDKNNPLLLNEIFIKEKIFECNENIKSIETELNNNNENKMSISNNILQNISEYIITYNSSIDTFLNNCTKLLQKIESEGKDNKLQEIFDDLVDAINLLSLNNISVFKINNELIELFSGINKVFTQKINSVDNLLKAINDSYNINILKEEIDCNENIIYYNNKNANCLNNMNNKNKVINQPQNDDEKFATSYNEYKKSILSAKNKYKEIINKFCAYKNNICCQKNAIEKNISFFKNINDNDKEEKNNQENNEELNYEIKLILNKIENNKNLIRQIINKLNDDINNNINKNKECLESIPNNSSIRESIENDISIKNEIEEKIKEIKSNYLLMKSLPSNYETYMKYLSISILESKNQILEDKLKLIFGDKFNCNNIYNIELKPEIIWNKNDIPKLASEIMILKENKNLLEKDYSALQLAFNLALKGKEGINDNQMIILFRIKEENKQLKKELKKIKEKNNALQEKIKKLNKENIKNKINIGNEIYENMNTNNTNYNNYLHTLGDCSISEIKETNNFIASNLKKKVKNNINNDYINNNSILNDMSNGFTPKRKKKRIMSTEK